ncbi:MAG: FkbM family methyltransferase [Blastocatellia bacterium]|jgi:FkbM family methyltransferase
MARELIESLLEAAYGRKGITRRVNGLEMRVHPRVRDRFIVDYDAPVADCLRGVIRPGMTCLNVGANVGIFAIQMAAWCGPDGRVIAFEPNPDTAALLRRHIEMNNLGSRIRVVQAATAAESGMMDFYAAGTDGMSRLGSPNPLLAATTVVQVEVTTLDSYCERESIRPDVVLMDVEGYEVFALRGFRQTIASNPNMQLVVEFHPSSWADAGCTAGEMRELLESLGLIPVPLTGQADPIDDYGVVRLTRSLDPVTPS